MKRLLTREKGQGLVEYALILVLVAIVVIAILLLLGPVVGNVFSKVVTVLQEVGGVGGGSLQFSIQDFNTAAFAGCVIKVSVLKVAVTEDGLPAPAGTSVSATVTLSNGDSATLSGSTDASGIAQWNDEPVGTDCSSGTATATVPGDSKQDTY